ncbi:MAG: NAD(P)-dependent oxidoreductase [Sphingomonas sp.]|nr:NAD(P)-dependent oxidoreductase [Sphingomonas sp.]
MTKVAFLGTGLMGAPMVLRLLAAGFEVHVWNRSPEKALQLGNAGATLAASPSIAISGADIVCLCLTDGHAVEDLFFGAAAAAAALDADTLIVDFSTIGPVSTRSLAARVSQRVTGVRWVDAPVTGGVKGAENGELVILAGGEPSDVETVHPLLSCLGKRVCHLGPLGAGQAAKLCNQLIVAINVVAIAEALALARANGLDISALPDALAGGWADSLPLQIIGQRMASGIYEPPIVAVGTFGKDLALVLGTATGEPPALAGKAAAIYRAAAAAGIGMADATALLGFIEQAGER